MFKSISYYNTLADNYVKETQRTFSKALVYESINSRVKYGEGGSVDKHDFDIFLSHSYLDQKTVLGIYKDFEALGFDTYVDWIIDPALDRTNITKETAQKLKQRMKQSKCLIYATSSNILSSNWMPWELGFMDGYSKGKVAVFPLLEDDQSDEDLELPKYLELYYSCSKEQDKTGKEALWINDSPKYIRFNRWLYENKQPIKHA